METDVIPGWHYTWKRLYCWLLSVCQITCLYLKVHNSPEISSYAAGLVRLRRHCIVYSNKLYITRVRYFLLLTQKQLYKIKNLPVFLAQLIT